MTAARYEDPNTQILRAFGITQQRVVAADLSLRPGMLPRFTVDCLVGPDTIRHEVLAFDLVPRPPKPAPTPAFDRDAMCAAAQQRLATAVNQSADRALAEWREESDAIRVRMNEALRLHREEAAGIMVRLEHLQAMRELIRTITKSVGGLVHSSSLAAEAMGVMSSALASIPDGADAFHFGHGIGLGGNLNGKCRGGI